MHLNLRLDQRLDQYLNRRLDQCLDSGLVTSLFVEVQHFTNTSRMCMSSELLYERPLESLESLFLIIT